LKERQAKKYSFPDSNISRMLDDLLKANLIELQELECPEKANQVENPNYCKYHLLINHLVEKCFVLIDKIMRLDENGDIILDNGKSERSLITGSKLELHLGSISKII